MIPHCEHYADSKIIASPKKQSCSANIFDYYVQPWNNFVVVVLFLITFKHFEQVLISFKPFIWQVLSILSTLQYTFKYSASFSKFKYFKYIFH